MAPGLSRFEARRAPSIVFRNSVGDDRDEVPMAQAMTPAVPAQIPDRPLHERVVESSLDCIKVLDLEGRLLSMNPGGMALLEICDLAPYLGSSWIEFSQGADRAAAIAAVEAARRGENGRFLGRFATVESHRPLYFDVVVSPIRTASGETESLLAVSRDVTQWKRSEDLLRAITCGTAAATGEAFFPAFVEQLCRGLGVRYAFVAECLPGRRARALAFWQGDRPGDSFEYDLAGTPCADVIAGDTCFHPEKLQQLFPSDLAFVELAAESYLGVPLFGADGKVIGHLVVMDTQPMAPDPLWQSVLESFAARAAAEIARTQATRELRGLSDELRVLLDVNRVVSRRLARDELFGALALRLRDLFETDRFGIELPIEGERLQGHLLTPHEMEERPTRLKILPTQGTACKWVLGNREWLVSGTRDELRERFALTHEVMSHEGMESLCALPLVSQERGIGVLYFMAARRGAYDALPRRLLEQIASAVAVALDDCLAHEEVRALRDRLAAENTYLREEIRSEHNFAEIVGTSSALRTALAHVEQIAATDATTLILGETGTGKELVARAIHDLSHRRDRPLVKVNCAAISSGLVESELFGHVRGAFTGALEARKGRFELADGGTLFLDEVGELPLETQAKLLRVLQEREFEPIGSSKSIQVDVRLIAATNRDLEAEVAAGRFRSDLYFRLAVVPIALPPLRERVDDIPLLALFFVDQCAKRFGKRIAQIDDDTLARLRAYPWPGNVRELANVIERAMVLATGSVLQIDASSISGAAGARGGEPARAAAPASATPSAPAAVAPAKTGNADESLEAVERQHVLAVLGRCSWRIEGLRGAAKALGLSPSTLRSRMQRLGIERPRAPRSGAATASER
jgi:transcriptional regulator with GAF, ATPase, and Fis domain